MHGYITKQGTVWVNISQLNLLHNKKALDSTWRGFNRSSKNVQLINKLRLINKYAKINYKKTQVSFN